MFVVFAIVNPIMERDFLSPEDCEKLKRFAELMRQHGKMQRITDDEQVAFLMATRGAAFPPAPDTAKHKIALFGDATWCYLAVAHCGNEKPEDNGLCALQVDRKFLQEEFEPEGKKDPTKAKGIIENMLMLLNCDPRQVDLERMTILDNRRN